MARPPRQSVVGTSAVLTPEQLAMSGTEHGEQCAFFQWIVLEGSKQYEDLDLFYAVPNGGDRQAHVGAAMRAEGVKRGVPDTCLPVPVGRYAGLYIEFKRRGLENKADGALSSDQVKWTRRLAGKHYAVAVAYGWVQAVAVVHRYMLKEPINERDGPLFVSDELLRKWGL